MKTRPGFTLPACGVALAAIAVLAPAAVGANVIENGGAEDGAGATDRFGLEVVRPPSWTPGVGTISAQEYGIGGFPEAGSGRNFFFGGPAGNSSAEQVIPLAASGHSRIDSGQSMATLSAQIGGYRTQDDNAVITAEFLGARGGVLGRLTIGPVLADERGYETMLLPKSASGSVPPRTRSVRVTLTVTRVIGSSNDGYVDDIALDLDVGVAEPVIPRLLKSRNPTMVYTSASGAKLNPPIAIVRHGARVRFCNRSPVFRKPFIGVPSGDLLVSRDGAANPPLVTLRPRQCVNFFAKLLRPNGEYRKRLAKRNTRRARVTKQQITRGFDRRTGRLLAPNRRGKRGVCWRIYDRIDQDQLTAIYVLPKGQRAPFPADIRAARACVPGGPPGGI